jgi:hypothetical protein
VQIAPSDREDFEHRGLAQLDYQTLLDRVIEAGSPVEFAKSATTTVFWLESGGRLGGRQPPSSHRQRDDNQNGGGREPPGGAS